MQYLRYQGGDNFAAHLELGPIGRAFVPEAFTPPAGAFDAWKFLRLKEAEPPPGGLLREYFHHGILHAR